MQQGVGDESVFLEVFDSRLTNYDLEKWTEDKGNSSKLYISHFQIWIGTREIYINVKLELYI